MPSGLAQDLLRAADPAVFAEDLGLAPLDPWQADALRSAHPRALWNIARQCGKSTIAAVVALHQAIYRPGSLTLLLSPSQRQSGELFLKVSGMYKRLGRPVPAEALTALTLKLENGSRIVSLPGTEGTIRGYSGVALLIVDEASRVPDEVIAAARPMLATSGGRLLGISTPAGKRGWWHAAWMGREDWERVQVRADQVPRIPAEFLAEELRTVGTYYYQQEYECKFVSALTNAFDADDVDALFSEEVHGWDFQIMAA